MDGKRMNKNIEIDKVYNCDCLDLMKEMIREGVKADWCITDPPYGIGMDGSKKWGSVLAKATQYTAKQWDKQRIEKPYFDIMREVSKEQIIFGGNYYTDYLPPSSWWIVWDKVNGANYFADCELAWSSYKGAVRLFRYMWQGMLQANSEWQTVWTFRRKNRSRC